MAWQHPCSCPGCPPAVGETEAPGDRAGVERAPGCCPAPAASPSAWALSVLGGPPRVSWRSRHTLALDSTSAQVAHTVSSPVLFPASSSLCPSSVLPSKTHQPPSSAAGSPPAGQGRGLTFPVPYLCLGIPWWHCCHTSGRGHTPVDLGLILQLPHRSPSAGRPPLRVLTSPLLLTPSLPRAPGGPGPPLCGVRASYPCCHSAVVMEHRTVLPPGGPRRDPAPGVTTPRVGPATHM